jgi:hypothetical protein
MSAKRVIGLAILSALLLAVLLLPVLNGGGQVTELTGTVVAAFDKPAYAADSYYMRVALDSGREVRLLIPRNTMVRPGKSVVLSMRKSRLGITTYQFRRYANSSEEARGVVPERPGT